MSSPSFLSAAVGSLQEEMGTLEDSLSPPAAALPLPLGSSVALMLVAGGNLKSGGFEDSNAIGCFLNLFTVLEGVVVFSPGPE